MPIGPPPEPRRSSEASAAGPSGNGFAVGASSSRGSGFATDAASAAASAAAPAIIESTAFNGAPDVPTADGPTHLVFRTCYRPTRGIDATIRFPSGDGFAIGDFGDYRLLSDSLRQAFKLFGHLIYVTVGGQTFQLSLPPHVELYELLGIGDVHDGLVFVDPHIGTAYVADTTPTPLFVSLLSVFVTSLAAPRVRTVHVARAYVIKVHGDSVAYNKCLVEPTYIDAPA